MRRKGRERGNGCFCYVLAPDECTEEKEESQRMLWALVGNLDQGKRRKKYNRREVGCDVAAFFLKKITEAN